eukprot:TRINITY_DN18968_c0_g1_i2.p1 TRINITY_DN18968_c0_g1~~TRINITY_DN18968_c0_g1_i2.p1  ORF type:complete len:476 (+),score=181.00 TRINITY_DN18968_c0_g1_i2:38-1465(+)
MKAFQATRALRQGRRYQTLKAVNPYTGKVAWEERAWTSEEGVKGLLEADAAFKVYRGLELAKRSEFLRECGKILVERADEFAEAMAIEMGKPVAQGKAESVKCSTVADYYAENLQSMLVGEEVEAGFQKSYVTKQPLGTILLIMPWNFPFWQVFRQASAAYAAGCSVVCKHAPNVPKCARLIEEVFHTAARRAGIPEKVYVNLPMYATDIYPVMSHGACRAISFTGSTAAGGIVGSAASKLIKPSVLELGGNDPSLVLEDADIKRAAQCGAAGRMLNAGQSCIGSKRFLVVEKVYDEFLGAFVEEMQKYTMGNPMEMDTKLGTLVDHKAQKTLDEQTKATIKGGAKVALEGGMPQHEGAFFLPTVLYDVPVGTPGYEDELFGPVASVIRVKDEKEAIDVANSSKYGLGASIYSQDIERANRIAREDIEAGMCYINDFVKSHPRLPFGGVKNSGYGRECSAYGINTFCNIKSVVIA